MHQLHLVTQHLRGTEVVHVAGGLDDNNFANLAGLLTAHLRTCRQAGALPQIVLECSEVNYIGSVELRALLDLAHIARSHGGDLKCARLAPTIEQVANLVANGDPLDCYADVTTALDAFTIAPVAA
ncbi:MAG: STAS domain-containing protein [Verrucomicrobiota bacterium]